MDDTHGTNSEKERSQSDRFKEAARKAETNDDPEAFERVFGKIVPPIVPAGEQPKRPIPMPTDENEP